MKLFAKRKDGGPLSRVTGYWLLEAKSLLSIVLLRFDDGSREAYHSHAFNSWNWVLRGQVEEHHLATRNPDHAEVNTYRPSIRPVKTTRDTFHKVVSRGRTWVLSIRGPWTDRWQEWIPGRGFVTLTRGRRELPA